MANEYILRLQFDKKINSITGNEFQNLFYDIMKRTDKDFIEIKTQGSIGDRKCDGYIKNKGIFYQVYAPEDASNKETQKNAISKLRKDFEKLYAHTKNGHYEEIKEFIFVINTKGAKGIYPDLADELEKLEKEYNNINFRYMDTDSIKDLFYNLDMNNKRRIMDFGIPDISDISIKFEVIQEIVVYLNNNVKEKKFNHDMIVPEFDRKIEFNGLSKYIKKSLNDANLYVDDLNHYLSDSNLDSNLLCNIYKTLYKKAKEKYPDDPDEQFNYILMQSYDSDSITDRRKDYIYKINIIIIMAKFFNSCDIFEYDE